MDETKTKMDIVKNLIRKDNTPGTPSVAEDEYFKRKDAELKKKHKAQTSKHK
jgi:hypothetical protein